MERRHRIHSFRALAKRVCSTVSRASALLPSRFAAVLQKASSILLSALLLLSFGLSGCLPKDVAMPSNTGSASTGSYTGFTGIATATTVGPTKVKVTWNQAQDASVIAYNIYDSTLLFSPKLLKTVAAGTGEATLINLTTQNLYSFRVRAANKDGKEDGNITQLSAIPYAGVLPAQVTSSSSAIIPFNDGSNADEVKILCTTTTNPVEQVLATVTNVTATTQAVVSGLSPGIVYTCRAALKIGDVIDNNTVTTTFTPMGTASALVFFVQPGSAAAGANLSTQPVVRILDANGTLVSAGPDSTSIVTLTIATSSPTNGSIRGTSAVAAVGGIATFSGLNLQEAGAKIVTATKSDTSSQALGSASISVDSNQFTITPGAVSPLTTTIAITPAVPPNMALIANGSNSYQVTMTLKDAYSNPISGIKPTFSSNISGDTLTQPAVNANASGVATGSISSTIADSVAPFRSLAISSPSGLSSVSVYAPFVPGTASKLAFTTQPVNSPAGLNGLGTLRVAIVDAQGNTVNTGAASTSVVSMAISANVGGATLTGTTAVAAVDGVATFPDLGISKTGNGYKLLATSGGYTAAYSNSFNVTAGTPNKISIAGVSNVISGACSTAITVQLQDQGGNSANAVQSTPIIISGLGSGALYSSSTCSGAPISGTVTFTAGTSTKTYYLKDNKGEGLTITGTDPSNVLVTGTLAVNVNPNKISLLAESSPGVPLSVVAGQCSSAIVIQPAGENGAAAPLFAATTVSVSGIMGSSAVLYSDAGCTAALTAASIPLPITSGGGSTAINIYLKDPKAETLSLSVTDPSSVLTTTSSLQTVTINPSHIGFTGPVSVVSGACSSAFTVSLKDAQGNLVVAAANKTLNIKGLESSATALFYPSSSCASGGSASTVTVPQGNSSIQVYFKNSAAENLNVYLQDPLAKMADSPTISIAISPSSLKITTPMPATAKTSVCAGPFTLNTMDGSNNVTSAISAITVDLTGQGIGGTFYTDALCTTPGSQYIFSTGQSAKTFYFKGQRPESLLTFTATDAGAVLTDATATFTITAAPAFIGTAGKTTDSNSNTLWFTQGVVPISARQDAPSSVADLHFDSTYQYLYVADTKGNRILKYDYTNHQYIGWIGAFWSGAGIGVTGSNLSTPSNAACAAVSSYGQQLPGWCYGGLSVGVGNTTTGNFNYPTSVTDDGTYIYVANRNSLTINRYDATTGAFKGWIGRVATTPTAAAVPGGPGTCTSTAPGNMTPGWCVGGDRTGAANMGDGTMWYPRVLTHSGGYLYVANQGSILRFLASNGSFQGWIGKVATTPTGGVAGCTATGANVTTPGWCTGGTSVTINPKSFSGGGVNDPTGIYVQGSTLYVVQTDSGGTINTYDVNTGAYLGWLSGLAFNWTSPRNITSDGADFFVADWGRLIKIDPTGLLLGWMGKVSNNNSMSGNVGCSTLNPNDNTPGFCLGGSAKYGMDEKSFHELTAIAYDGNGYVLTGQGDTFPAIKKFNSTTGAYAGTLGAQPSSPTEWSNDTNAFAQNYGFDDNSMFGPASSYSDGTNLYVVEANAARIKKINLATGATVGWIGGMTSVPTGGAVGCTAANPMGASPGWCLGALFNPWYVWNSIIPNVADGIMYYPTGIAGDGTHLYVVDMYLHRIQKFNMATGAYVGWIGWVGTSPIGGAAGCSGAATAAFTPGWCLGGMSTNGSGNGALWNPTALTVVAGNIYVMDSNNHRVSSYNAATGAFNGWIGRTNVAPTGGCTTGSNGSYTVSTSGWCTGGTSQQASSNDRGGGFSFWGSSRGGLTSDGTYLYIANLYNIRVDKYSLGGVWLGAASSRETIYNRVWSNDPVVVSGWGGTGCSYPLGLWTDGTNLYGVGLNICGNGNANAAWKMGLSTGTMIGWQGGINPGNSPTGGDAGCSGATIRTPGWCQGGLAGAGYRLGQFTSNAYGISGDTNFVYVSDESTHRVTRLPK